MRWQEKRAAELAKEEEKRAKLAAKRKAIAAAREHDRREEEKRIEAKLTLHTDYTAVERASEMSKDPEALLYEMQAQAAVNGRLNRGSKTVELLDV